MGKPEKESKKDKKEKKEKKEKKDKESKKTEKGEAATPAKGGAAEKEFDYDECLKKCTVISKPMASEKLTKKVLKATKKAAKAKVLRRGVKEVVKAVRKGEQGFVIIAGDISPIDVIAHLPILCEDKDVPYCYVPSKEQLGQAGCTKRPTSCVMIKSHADVDNFDECKKELSSLEIPNAA